MKPVSILISTGIDIERRLEDPERRVEPSSASSDKAYVEQPLLTHKRRSNIALLLEDEESEQDTSRDLSSQSVELSEAPEVINPSSPTETSTTEGPRLYYQDSNGLLVPAIVNSYSENEGKVKRRRKREQSQRAEQ